MDKIVVTALLIVAGVISAIGVFNSIFPAITQSGTAMASMQQRIDQRMKSQVEVIQATNAPGNTVQIWVKNIGDARIAPPESSDLFFGLQGNFSRIAYNTGTGYWWDYVIENDTAWNPRATLRITIHGYPALVSGTQYFVKLALATGIVTDYYFSW